MGTAARRDDESPRRAAPAANAGDCTLFSRSRVVANAISRQRVSSENVIKLRFSYGEYRRMRHANRCCPARSFT